MQWLLGLLEQGLRRVVARVPLDARRSGIDRAYIDLFWQYVRRTASAERVVLGYFPTGSKGRARRPARILGAMTEADFVARKRDGLLLNMVHSMTPPLREGSGRTVLFDLDPGPFQIWASQWDMGRRLARRLRDDRHEPRRARFAGAAPWH
jgi:hypothetical protein